MEARSTREVIAAFRRTHRVSGCACAVDTAHDLILGMPLPLRAATNTALQAHIHALALNERGEILDHFKHLSLLDVEDCVALEPRPVQIDSVLRVGEVAILAGAAKARKTWLALDLAQAMAEEAKWCAEFQCRLGSVLYIDAECPPEVLGERLRINRVGSPTMQDQVQVLSCRGNAPQSVDHACEMIRQGVAQADARLVIIDTLSAFLPMSDENDNAEATHLMSEIVRVAEEMDVSILLIHHTPKGGGAQRSTVDAAAGAGAFARRADTVLAVREEDEITCLDIRARSFPGRTRFHLAWNAAHRPVATEAPPEDPPEDAPKRSRRRSAQAVECRD